MILAVDALSGATPRLGHLPGQPLPLEFPEIGLDCGCGRPRSRPRAAGCSTRIDPHTSVSSKPSASARR